MDFDGELVAIDHYTMLIMGPRHPPRALRPSRADRLDHRAGGA